MTTPLSILFNDVPFDRFRTLEERAFPSRLTVASSFIAATILVADDNPMSVDFSGDGQIARKTAALIATKQLALKSFGRVWELGAGACLVERFFAVAAFQLANGLKHLRKIDAVNFETFSDFSQ